MAKDGWRRYIRSSIQTRRHQPALAAQGWLIFSWLGLDLYFDSVDVWKVSFPKIQIQFIKVMIDGQVSKPFSMETVPPREKDYRWVEVIRDYSSTRYGRDKNIIEAELRQRLSYASTPAVSTSPIESDMPVK